MTWGCELDTDRAFRAEYVTYIYICITLGSGNWAMAKPAGPRRKRLSLKVVRDCVTRRGNDNKRTHSKTICSNCRDPICKEHQNVNVYCDTCQPYLRGLDLEEN